MCGTYTHSLYVLHFFLQCCMDDNYKIAKMLLTKSADVGLVDGDLWAPLHVACSCAGQDLVLLLLEVRMWLSVA